MSSPNSTRVEKKAIELIMEVTILHELVHFGDMQDRLIDEDRTGKDGNQFGVSRELGWHFEKSAYGQYMDLETIKEYVKIKFPELEALDEKDADDKFQQEMNRSLSDAQEDANKAYVPVSTETKYERK